MSTFPVTAVPMADSHYALVPSGRGAFPGLPASGPSPSHAPVLRRVEIAYVSPSGQEEETARLIPSLSPFEDAFAAFARGTLFPTERGLVAVEDLWPGMVVRVADGRLARLLWRGSTMIVPRGERQDPAMTRLTRLSAETMGLGRPFHDLVLGPRARMAHRRAGVRLLTGREAALIPAPDFVDGEGIVEVTPPSPVEVFHLGFARHELLIANGVEVESLHPGPLHAFPLKGDQLSLFLSCFPHLADLTGFGDPALPRLRLRDLDLFDAA